MQKHDSSIYYYQGIQKALNQYQKNFINYHEGFEKFDKDFVYLWNGIANGGIGHNFLQKGNSLEAETLLNQNLSSTQELNQLDDIAKVQNNLGLFHEYQNNHKYTIKNR